jgi:hypothetical protein
MLAFLNRGDAPAVAWIHGLYQRKDVALHRADPAGRPRLVVIGGSGALYGIDAQLIGRRLHVDAINDGAHAGLGTYILHRARSVLRPGDTALLCPEYELWWGKDMPDIEWDYVVTYDKRFVWSPGIAEALRSLYSVPGADYWDSLMSWAKRLQGLVAMDPDYNLAAVDGAGDLRIVPPHKPFSVRTACRLPDADDPGCAVQAYREFGQWARANHVRVLYSWPNLYCSKPPPGGVSPAVRKTFDDCGFNLLNAPSETCYPRDWFTDTPYHLNGGGRRVRTEALVCRLRPYFGRPAEPDDLQGIYLVGRETRWLRDGNAFDDRPGVRAKYLVTQPTDNPDAITPDQLAALARHGVPIYCDDPAVQAILPAQLWDAREVDRDAVTIGTWLKRYDRHVFVLARSGAPSSGLALLGDDVPAEIRNAMNAAAPALAIVGTGPWRNVRKVSVREKGVYLDTSLANLVGRRVPHLGVAAGARAGRSSIRANGRTFVAADDGEICVAVFDPEQSILVDAGTFQGGATKTVWSMKQLFPRPGPSAAQVR